MTRDRFDGFGPDALNFLKALDFHQSREWFQENKALYERELRAPLLALCGELAECLTAEGLALRFDEKKGPFRINRDVRFSKDKRPYNRHVSAVISPDGTKRSFGIVYVHVGLEETFAAAGFYALPKDELAVFRRNVATYPERALELSERLEAKGLKLSDDEALKRLPRGFEDPGDERVAALLRAKGYTVSMPLPAQGIHSRDVLDLVVEFGADVKPLLDWGWRILA